MMQAFLAFGDYQQQVGDERTLLYQNRLRSEIADLEWIARVGTYHGTICAYISSMMIPIAYCSNLPHFPSIMSTPFGSLSITAIVFNATAAMLSYMTIRKARNIPAEFPLRRTYQTPEPSWVPHYMHYIRGRCRNHCKLLLLRF
ncbi:hypothetical protein CPB85DRAFT_621679 [Mucidula mucida]|nr:hypothetical protein CPB85DRAFT_621679 [Mucidula mucida]